MSTFDDPLKSFLALAIVTFVVGCQSEPATPGPSPAAQGAPMPAPAWESAPTPPPPAEPTKVGEPVKRSSGLVYETLKEGTGAQARAGDRATIHCTAAVEDGKVFFSTRDASHPATFELGNVRLIQGWNEGIAGMKVGERRKLTIPSNLAYGALGRLPAIPPNSTLTLDIELLAIGEPPPDLKAQSLGAKFTIPSTAEMDAAKNEWIDTPTPAKKKS